MARAGQELTFNDDTTRATFLETINASMMREQRRKEQKKIGESFHDTELNTVRFPNITVPDSIGESFSLSCGL